MFYDIRGEVESVECAERILSALRTELPRQGAYVKKGSESTLEFGASLMQSNRNLFAGISHGIVSVEQGGEFTILSYRISLWLGRLVLVALSVVALAVAASFGRAQVILGVLVFVFVGIWGIGYGVNRATMRQRIEAFFLRVVSDLETES